MRTFTLETDAVMARVDGDGVVEAVSAAWLRLARRRLDRQGPANVGRRLDASFGPACGALPTPARERLENVLDGETWSMVHHYARDGSWWRLEVRREEGGVFATHTSSPAHEHIAALLAHSPARVVDVARDATLVWASAGWLTSRPDREDVQDWLDAVHPTDVTAVRRAIADAGPTETVVRARLLEHRDRWSETRLHVQARDLGDGDFASVVVTAVDVTDEVRDRDRMAWRAQHDGLTGLVVRSVFAEHLRHELDSARRDGRRTGVLFADIDGFKSVNDRHGHLIGDEVLRTIARRIRSSTRPGDVVARFGGDEFVVLLPEMEDDGDAQSAADRLVDAISKPVAIGELDVPVAMSVGVVVAERGMTPEEVLRLADEAMYRVKLQDDPTQAGPSP